MIAKARLAPPAVAFVLVAAVLAAVLAGCAPAPSDLDAQLAASLQASTEKVRSEAAAGQYSEALRELSAIEAQADDAANQGKLSPARKQDILAAVALVRADLQTHTQASPSAAPTAADSASPTGSQDQGDQQGKPRKDRGRASDQAPPDN